MPNLLMIIQGQSLAFQPTTSQLKNIPQNSHLRVDIQPHYEPRNLIEDEIMPC